MLIAGGGGGAGGTMWGLMSVEQMQLLIQNPDTDKHYELLTGWKRSADLLNEHRWQVQNYRDNLAAVWPPEKNAASAAYLVRLDELLTNLNETYEAAISNHDAFAAATLSLSLAQKDMQEIANEHETNKQLLVDFTAKQQNTSGVPQPSPSPSGEQPPVAPGRQEELRQKAVTLLSGVSADLAQAQVNIRTPQLYNPLGRLDDPEGGGGTSYPPPQIPPITPTFVSDTSTTPGSKRPSTSFPTSPTVTPPGAPQPPAPQPGLILGGTTPLATTPPTTGTPPLTPGIPGGTPGPTTGPGPFPVTPNKFVPSGGNTIVPPTNGPLGRGSGLPREGIIRPGGPTSGGLHVMPPGGMIGGIPGTGVAQPGTARPTTQRINPVGGVIGGGTPQSRSTGANTPGQHAVGGTYGQPGRRGISQGDREEQSHWDPDNPWKTASGVDPVVLPPRHQRVDPGPAIGLN